jgi:hypothetical protein
MVVVQGLTPEGNRIGEEVVVGEEEEEEEVMTVS